MKIINPIFVSMALVVATLFFCGKKMNFLLYTLLGRIIIVLFIIGLTIVNKYAGIVATFTISALYYHTDYKEGFVEANEDDDEDDEDDEDDDEPQNAEYSSGPAFTPTGGDISSSSAVFPSDANPPIETPPVIEPPSTTPIESSSTTFDESSSS